MQIEARQIQTRRHTFFSQSIHWKSLSMMARLSKATRHFKENSMSSSFQEALMVSLVCHTNIYLAPFSTPVVEKNTAFIYLKKLSADFFNLWYWDSQKPTLH